MKRVMKSALLVLFALTAGAAAEARTGDAAIVKIYSGLPGSAPSFVGSALLFRSGQDAYVITSDHVTAHDNTTYAHSIYNSIVGKLKVDWMYSDWGRGYGLLKVAEPAKLAKFATEIPELDELNAESAKAPMRVILAGFPGQALSKIEAGGDLTSDYQDHKLFFQISRLVKVDNTQAEFGMSGGAMLSEATHTPIGLISHQTMDPSAPSASGIVIPYAEIFPCLKKAIVANDMSCWNFREQTDTGLNKEQAYVSTGSVHMSYLWIHSGMETAEISFDLLKKPSTALYQDIPWLKRVNDRLVLQSGPGQLPPHTPNGVRLVGWRYKGKPGKWWHMRERSLGEILAVLEKGELEPVAVLPYDNYDVWRNRMDDLARKYESLLSGCAGIYDNEVASMAYNMGQYIKSDTWTTRIEEDGWLSFKAYELDDMLNNPKYADDWTKVPYSVHWAFKDIADAVRGMTL